MFNIDLDRSWGFDRAVDKNLERRVIGSNWLMTTAFKMILGQVKYVVSPNFSTYGDWIRKMNLYFSPS